MHNGEVVEGGPMVEGATAESPFDWLRIGHWTNRSARTGCTVVLLDGDVVAAGEVRGSAPATREFALLNPTCTVESINGVCLSGGSAFGLAVGDGVARSLHAAGVGYPTQHGVVPIVVGMSLFDLGVGDRDAWPGTAEGELAAQTAGARFEIGAVGAGAGATIGKWLGEPEVSSGGLGFAHVSAGELSVCALVAVNAYGSLAGPGDSRDRIISGEFAWPETGAPIGENTTIGVIATNADLTKTQCRSVAEAGHDGFARALIPAHTPFDGDALVTIAKPQVDARLDQVRLLAEVVVEEAIRSAVARR